MRDIQQLSENYERIKYHAIHDVYLSSVPEDTLVVDSPAVPPTEIEAWHSRHFCTSYISFWG